MAKTRTIIKISLFAAVCFLIGCASSRVKVTDKAAIAQLMQEQSAAWNTGDLEKYMEPYWHSDSLLFIGKNGPTYGWEKTLQNYRRSYPNPEAMGKLTFTLLQTDRLSKDVYFVVGKWHLRRNMGDLQGHFTLVFRKIGQNWKIVADHSS